MPDESMVVVYDGDCPFCSDFVRLQNLRKNVGRVELVDARSDDPRVIKLLHDYDLDEGMVVLYGDKVHYGHEAVILMSTLSGAAGLRGRLTARLLRDRRRAELLYPFMKWGRGIVLKILGREKIGRPTHSNVAGSND